MYEVTFGWGNAKDIMIINDTRSLMQLADDLKSKGYIITTPADGSGETTDASKTLAVMATHVSQIRRSDD